MIGSQMQMIARLLDVNFPDYEKILGKGNDKVAIVPRVVCQSAIRRVALFSPERARGVRLSFEKDLLTIASASRISGNTSMRAHWPRALDSNTMSVRLP